MRGRIVCNTGPLVALAVAGKLDLLRELFDEVYITRAIREEILQGSGGRESFEAALSSGWISVVEIGQAADPLLEDVLDAGEASVIRLCLQMGAAHVLMDERKGRKIAGDVYGLKVMGTAGLLVEAKKRGLVSHVGDVMESMRSRGYWFSEEVMRAARQASGEGE